MSQVYLIVDLTTVVQLITKTILTKAQDCIVYKQLKMQLLANVNSVQLLTESAAVLMTKCEGRWQLAHEMKDNTLNWQETTTITTLIKWNIQQIRWLGGWLAGSEVCFHLPQIIYSTFYSHHMTVQPDNVCVTGAVAAGGGGCGGSGCPGNTLSMTTGSTPWSNSHRSPRTQKPFSETHRQTHTDSHRSLSLRHTETQTK